MIAPRAKASPAQLRTVRRTRPVGCPEHLIVALPWVSYEANLGTLLRTCDAVGACMAVPSTSTYKSALVRGDTLSRRKGARILAVELADDAVPLASLGAARQRTVVLLGHEHNESPMKRGRLSTPWSRFRWKLARTLATASLTGPLP